MAKILRPQTFSLRYHRFKPQKKLHQRYVAGAGFNFYASRWRHPDVAGTNSLKLALEVQDIPNFEGIEPDIFLNA